MGFSFLVINTFEIFEINEPASAGFLSGIIHRLFAGAVVLP